MNKSKKNGLDSLGNVDQIRELLFGSQLKDINASIENLSSKFEALQTNVEASTKVMKDELHKRLEEDTANMQKRLKQSTSQLKEEIVDMNEQTLKLERRIQTAADIGFQELEDTIEANKAASQRSVNELKEELLRTQEHITGQLNNLTVDTDDRHLSKEMMSEMLMNMAMKVKGVTLSVEAEEKKK